MIFLIFLSSLLGILLSFLVYRENRIKPGYPKGPFCLPLIGSVTVLLWLLKNMAKFNPKVFVDIANTYGPALSLKLGPYRFLILNDPKLIKEAWSQPSLCGSLKIPEFTVRTEGVPRGILNTEGREWEEQRVFAIRHLRDFGLGKTFTESHIMENAEDLLSSLRRLDGTSINTRDFFRVAGLDTLWRIFTGRKTSDEPDACRILHDAFFTPVQLPMYGLVCVFPFLKKLAPKLSGWDRFVKKSTEVADFMNQYIANFLQEYEESREPSCFVEAYIREIRRTTDESSSFYGKRGEKTLLAVFLDFFLAGTDAIAYNFSYFFMYMVMFPEKQEKVFKEIDSVLRNKKPSLSDRSRLPYTEATLMETARFSPGIALGVTHKSVEDVQLGKYKIPKGTFLIPNFYAMQHSKEFWEDPENFRPERFLCPETGKAVRTSEYVMSFSWGKRQCPGERLSRDETFLIVTAIMQEFSVHRDPKSTEPLTTECTFALPMFSPKPHKLVFKKREC